MLSIGKFHTLPCMWFKSADILASNRLTWNNVNVAAAQRYKTQNAPWQTSLCRAQWMKHRFPCNCKTCRRLMAAAKYYENKARFWKLIGQSRNACKNQRTQCKFCSKCFFLQKISYWRNIFTIVNRIWMISLYECWSKWPSSYWWLELSQISYMCYLP